MDISTNPKVVTLEDLTHADACREGMAWFEKKFGNEVEVTQELVLRLLMTDENMREHFDWALSEGFIPKDVLAGADFSGMSLDGECHHWLGGMDLTGADFSNAKVEDVDFDYASLEGANFKGAKLCNCAMQSAEVEGANFEDAVFTGCRLGSTSLGESILHNTRFEDCELNDTGLPQKSRLRVMRKMKPASTDVNLGNMDDEVLQIPTVMSEIELALLRSFPSPYLKTKKQRSLIARHLATVVEEWDGAYIVRTQLGNDTIDHYRPVP